MQNRLFKRIGSLLMAAVMVFSVFAGGIPTAKADSWPNDTASAEPTFAGYRVKDIENWSPETDPYAEFLRASVPLQERNAPLKATQAKPYLESDTQVMNMTGDYGNSFFGSTMYTNEFSEDCMMFWQYTDYFSPWHGAATAYTPDTLYNPVTSDWRARGFEFGIVNIPNPAYTNAAHRNGVKSIACIYFDPAFRPGQTCADMLTEKDGDIYVIAQKLVEMAEYYGFDGYFLNQEEGSYQEFKPFMAYLTAQGLYTQWYDTNSSFNSSKAAWLKDGTYGQIHNSVFVNYSSFSGIDSQLEYAASIGADPHEEIFYGVECNQAGFNGSHYSATSMTNLYDENGNPRASYALFCGSDRYHRGLEGLDTSGDGESVPTAQKDAYQWMSFERQRMFWSGVKEDPTDTGMVSGYSRADVDVSNASGWVGVADFMAERSVIDGTAFYTNFNTGHGMQYFVDGEVSKDEEWTNINIQEQMPTWQWWFDSTDDTKLHADFDYGSALISKNIDGSVKTMDYTQVGAWNGGSSLAVYGNLTGTDTMHLFKTDLAVKDSTTASVTFKKVSSDEAVMKLGLIFADDTENVVTVALDGTAAAGEWTTAAADLSEYAGRQIAAMLLVFEGEAGNYQMNIGNITLTDGSHTPAAPTGLTLDTAYIDGQMILRWDMADYAQVVQYNLYGKQSDGSRVYLGGIYGDILYVKNTFAEDTVELQLCAVGIDGTESAPATLTYDYTTKVSSITVAEAVSTNGLTTHAANAGKVEVSFTAPAAGAPDSYALEVTLLNIAGDDPDNKVYTATADGSATSAVVEVPAPEGREYDLKIYAVNDGVRGDAIAYRGLSHDSYSEPIAEEDIVISGSTVRLVDPDSVDWYRMTATFDGSQVASFKRGASSGNKMTFSLSKTTGLLSVVVEDYSGNKSEPTVLQLENGVPVDPSDLITEEHFPDAALLAAVRAQVGVTLATLEEFTGTLDLSNTAVADLTGIHRLTAMTGLDFTNCTSLETISGLKDCTALKQIVISGCKNLKKLDLSGLGLEKLEGEGTFNSLTYVNISDNKLDLSEGTPERAFLDTAIAVVENGVVTPEPTEPEPTEPEPTEPEPTEPELPVESLGDNLVPGATVVASSNINDVTKFVDGDTGTDTYADDRTAQASVTLDLGEEKNVGGFAVWTKMNSDATPRPFGIKSAKLEISDSADGPWTEAGSVTIAAGDTAETLIHGLLQLDNAVTGRYVKVTVTEWWPQPNGDNDWPAMYELEVFEAVIKEVVIPDSYALLSGDMVIAYENLSEANAKAFVDGTFSENATADTQNRGLDASVTLDLGEEKTVTAFELWGKMNADASPRPYGNKSAKLEISDSADGEWTEVASVTLVATTTPGEQISAKAELATAVTARYLKITITDMWEHPSGGYDWPAVYDAMVYGYSSTAAAQSVARTVAPVLMSDSEEPVSVTILGTHSAAVAGEGLENAFDGDYSTKWCSETTPNYVVFDTGAPIVPTRLKVTHAGGAAEPEDERFNTNDFALQILNPAVLTEDAFLAMSESDKAIAMSTDSNWMDLLTYTANEENVTDDTIATDLSAQVYRLKVTDADDNWWNGPDTIRIYEVELFGEANPTVKFQNQRPVPYSAVRFMTEDIVREVAEETLDMQQYALQAATIRGNNYATLDQQLIKEVKFIADDVDVNARSSETLTVSIADQNRQPIEGSVIDLSFDATWTARYADAQGVTVGTLTVIVGDGGETTEPQDMMGNPFILYATEISDHNAAEDPEKAFDKDVTTKWCPGGNALQAELSIDVGAWYSLTEVSFIHAGAQEGYTRNTVDFQLQVLKDTNPTSEQLNDDAYLTNDDNWVTVASWTGNSENETHYTFDEPVVGRYFRLDVLKGDASANWPSTRIYEWGMTGVPCDAPGSHEHTWTDATCTEPKTCTVCGETEGEALGHDYVDGVCSRCGETDPDYEKPVPGTADVIRLSGENRYQTAFAVANQLKELMGVEQFSAVVVAYGQNFPDALTGSYLAAVKNAPILLTEASVDTSVLEYVQTNLVPGGKVYILGGTAAVSQNFEDEAKALGFDVQRLKGDNRYGTNLAILNEADVNADDEILIATGANYADSLSASATGLPMLLVGSSLTEDQKAFLATTSGKFVIIGGTSAVSETVEAQLNEIGTAERIKGDTRYETSVVIAQRYFSNPKAAVLAYAQGFPDGLCGGPLAVVMGAPLILTSNELPTAADAYIEGITTGAVTGGTGRITDDTVRQIFDLADDAEIVKK